MHVWEPPLLPSEWRRSGRQGAFFRSVRRPHAARCRGFRVSQSCSGIHVGSHRLSHQSGEDPVESYFLTFSSNEQRTCQKSRACKRLFMWRPSFWVVLAFFAATRRPCRTSGKILPRPRRNTRKPRRLRREKKMPGKSPILVSATPCSVRSSERTSLRARRGECSSFCPSSGALPGIALSGLLFGDSSLRLMRSGNTSFRSAFLDLRLGS